MGSKAYINNYHWHAEASTRFLVIDKDKKQLVAILESEPYFCFHHINAFEDADRIIIDAAIYDNANIIHQLRLSNLLSPKHGLTNARLQRIVLRLTKRSVDVQKPSECNIELPRINYALCNSKPYAFAYGCSLGQEAAFLDRISKVNLQTGDVKVWREDGTFPGEPVFAPHPGAEEEDEGVILSVVLDGKRGNSFLLILDAQNMEERARATIPDVVPFGFHGQLFPH